MLVNVRTVGLFVAQSSLSRASVQGSTVCLPKKKFRFYPFGERNVSLLQMLNVDAYLTPFLSKDLKPISTGTSEGASLIVQPFNGNFI